MRKLDEKLGVEFKNRKYIDEALTHPSKSKNNYQRLEFLGDSILDFLVGEYLFLQSNKSEGDLTVLRAHFVSEEYLSECFDKLGIEDELNLGKSLQGKVTRAIKGDVFEAIIGAIYLEKGIEFTRNFIIERLNLANFENVENNNYKSELQELVQANFKCIPMTKKWILLTIRHPEKLTCRPPKAEFSPDQTCQDNEMTGKYLQKIDRQTSSLHVVRQVENCRTPPVKRPSVHRFQFRWRAAS